MDKTNETEEMKKASPNSASTSSKNQSAQTSSKSSSDYNSDDDELLEVDEVSFSGGCPCSGSTDSKNW